MRVGILGAGAIGYGTAALLAEAGHEPLLWSPSGTRTSALAVGQSLTATGAIQGTLTPRIASTCSEAVTGADVVFFALPANAYKMAFDAAAPHVRDGQPIVISSHLSFGALYLSKVLAERGISAPIAALASTLFTARQTSSTSVHIGTMRPKVDMAVIPESACETVHDLCTRLFGDRLDLQAGLLAIALGNMTPLSHLAIAMLNLTRMELGEDWSQSGNVTSTVGRLMEALDAERLAIAHAFGLKPRTVQEYFSLSYELPLGTVADMNQERYRQGRGVAGPKTLQSRYVLEDVPFGLLPTILLSSLTGTQAPLHAAGLAILSAAYGRDLNEDNDLLPPLGLDTLDLDQLIRLCRTGY